MALAVLLFVQPSSSFAQEVEANAQAHFDRANALYLASNYEDALKAYRIAAELSGSPNAWLGVARSLGKLGRVAESVGAYEQAVETALGLARTDKKYQSTYEAARDELREAAKLVGHLRIYVTPRDVDARVRIGGVDRGSDVVGHALAVMPGKVAVSVRAEGFEPYDQLVEIAAGAQVQLSAVLKPTQTAASTSGASSSDQVVVAESTGLEHTDDSAGGGLATAGWIALGLGAVGIASFATFALLADAQHDKLTETCVQTACSITKHDELASTGETYQTLTNLSLVVGAVGLATGLTALLIDAGGPDEEEAVPSVAVALDPHGGFASVRGRF